MSSSVLFFSKPSPLSTTKPSNYTVFPSTLSTPQCINFNSKETALPISVSSPFVSYPQPQPEPQSSINVEYLESEFGCSGVYFKPVGQSYVIKMVLENGSAASILLPCGLITSYKAKMWHGGTVELLHTSVLEDPTGRPIILGGISLSLNIFDDQGFSWSPTSWVLNDINGSPEETIQVEVISRDVANMVEVRHTLTLKDDTLRSQITVSAFKSSQLKLRGSIISHLNVSTPEATYAIGLERSNFFDREPLKSNFCIIPPDPRRAKRSGNKDEEAVEEIEGEEGEEDENYKHLTSQISRIYTCAPRNFTIIDRGKRNSVHVGRKGFEELYLYSPGSLHESYGKFSYICVGQSALLKPVSLSCDEVWTGAQMIHNPNL